MATTSIGRLRKRLTIEAPVETPDGAGGLVRSWSDLATVWAAIDPVGSEFGLATDRAGQTVTHRISLRWRDDLTTRHRLREGTRIHRIRSVHNADMENRFLVALTEELTS